MKEIPHYKTEKGVKVENPRNKIHYPDGTLQGIFKGCTQLTNIPEGTFDFKSKRGESVSSPNRYISWIDPISDTPSKGAFIKKPKKITLFHKLIVFFNLHKNNDQQQAQKNKREGKKYNRI